MELHWHPMSGNSRKALMALEEVGADYTLRQVDILHGAQHTPEYRRLNPNALVPTLVDGPMVLWESSAIVYYLAEIYPQAQLFASDPAQRASMVRWLVWQPVTIMPCIRRLREQTVMLPPGQAPDADTLARAKQDLSAGLRLVGDALGSHPYLCGQFGAADIVMLPHLWYAINEMKLELSSQLTDYVARLAQRPSWRAVLARAGSPPLAWPSTVGSEPSPGG